MGSPNKSEALKTLVEELFQLNGRLLAAGDKLSAGLGLTGARWQVLGALHLEQQPLTVAQIARRMGLQRQSVQRLCDILVEQKVLAYHDNPEHKRAKLVDFTEHGGRIFAAMEAIRREWSEQLTTDFTLDELESAAGVLRRLKEKLD